MATFGQALAGAIHAAPEEPRVLALFTASHAHATIAGVLGALEAGATLGNYSILARLRAGGMGVLYLARRLGPVGFSRPVVIKVIHDHLASNKRFVKMFIDEARLCARIDDPHVVRVEEFGEVDGRYYLVMEYVHGASLAQAQRVLHPRPGIPIEIAVAIAMQIAAGLHGAHEATDEEGVPLGIVHRDVSPGNVLLSYGGHVRLIDFGVAKARSAQGTGQTQTGSLRGKLAYMPPEQARSSKHVDRRADIYALGLVLWEMLVGKRLLNAPDDLALLTLLKNPPIVPPSSHGADVPKELDELVLHCLAVNPAERPSSAAELQRLLGEAYPPALRVIAPDIMTMMTFVRENAARFAEGSDELEPTSDAGGTLFGKSMLESITRAEQMTPRQSLIDLGLDVEPSVIVTGHDEETGKFANAPVKRIPRALPRAQANTIMIEPQGRAIPREVLFVIATIALAIVIILVFVVVMSLS